MQLQVLVSQSQGVPQDSEMTRVPSGEMVSAVIMIGSLLSRWEGLEAGEGILISMRGVLEEGTGTVMSMCEILESGAEIAFPSDLWSRWVLRVILDFIRLPKETAGLMSSVFESDFVRLGRVFTFTVGPTFR